ncbi:MAG: MATE family efflux transporter [Ruminococcaceae bacterium]|nr:MATE family efflux transporter [Oscillospiraceae bacterium]
MAIISNKTDLSKGPLFGKIVRFALPIMAMNFLQLLFNTADMIVVGRFTGSISLAAVGATGALINLIVNFFMGLSVGTSVVVAQDYGANKPDAVSRSVHTTVIISALGGLLVMGLGLAFCKPLLTMMGTPDDIIDLSVLYMRIYFLGIPASMIYNFSAGILRAVGDSRRPMYYLVVSGIVNVLLNLFFITVLHMTVDGVAWATTIAQYLAMTLILVCLYRSEGAIRLIPRQLRVDREKLLQIIRIGLPAGVQNLLFSISNVLIQSAVNSFGSTMVAASSASGNIESFVGTSMNAYYNAAITFTGQNMGARQYKRIDEVAKICAMLIFGTWFVLGGSIVLFSRPLLSIYTTDLAVIELGMMRMRIMMMVYFTCGIMSVFPGLSRGMGFSVLPMISTLVGACLMRIIWLVTVFALYPTPVMLFVSYPVTWTLAGMGQVAVFFYARRRIAQRAINERAAQQVVKLNQAYH